jgi:peptidyl-prolyl cis-trans isomerase B (cyclophilin B)
LGPVQLLFVLRSRFPIEKESVGMTTQNDLQAHIVTGRGTIHLRLFPEQTPLTVANFVNLALRKYYDGLTFHRVIPDFMIQGAVRKAAAAADRVIASKTRSCRPSSTTRPACCRWPMPGRARTAASSSSPTFRRPWLDGNHTVFGQILSGEDRAIVDAVRAGEKIGSISIRGDFCATVRKDAARLERWNQTLDGR